MVADLRTLQDVLWWQISEHCRMSCGGSPPQNTAGGCPVVADLRTLQDVLWLIIYGGSPPVGNVVIVIRILP